MLACFRLVIIFSRLTEHQKTHNYLSVCAIKTKSKSTLNKASHRTEYSQKQEYYTASISSENGMTSTAEEQEKERKKERTKERKKKKSQREENGRKRKKSVSASINLI